eukprot:7017774-Prymnesium_polylepis.1
MCAPTRAARRARRYTRLHPVASRSRRTTRTQARTAAPAGAQMLPRPRVPASRHDARAGHARAVLARDEDLRLRQLAHVHQRHPSHRAQPVGQRELCVDLRREGGPHGGVGGGLAQEVLLGLGVAVRLGPRLPHKVERHPVAGAPRPELGERRAHVDRVLGREVIGREAAGHDGELVGDGVAPLAHRHVFLHLDRDQHRRHRRVPQHEREERRRDGRKVGVGSQPRDPRVTEAVGGLVALDEGEGSRDLVELPVKLREMGARAVWAAARAGRGEGAPARAGRRAPGRRPSASRKRGTSTEAEVPQPGRAHSGAARIGIAHAHTTRLRKRGAPCRQTRCRSCRPARTPTRCCISW